MSGGYRWTRGGEEAKIINEIGEIFSSMIRGTIEPEELLDLMIELLEEIPESRLDLLTIYENTFEYWKKETEGEYLGL